MAGKMANTGARTDAQKLTRERARTTLQAGEWNTAAGLARDALKVTPNDPEMLFTYGWALFQSGNLQLGSIKLRQALGRSPDNPHILAGLGEYHRVVGEPEKAIEYLDRALAVSDHLRPLTLKCSCLAQLGRYEEAAALIEPRARAKDAPLNIVVAFADLTEALKRPEDGIELLQEALKQPLFHKGVRLSAMYVLGRLLDKVGRYDEAFAAYDRANKMSTPGPRFEIDGIKEMWTAEAYQKAVKSRVRTDRPVLVVGMPRSGTTLTESIIAAHPKAAGVGEQLLMLDLSHFEPAKLTQAQADAGAKRYHEMLDRLGSPKAKRVVDKMPDNYQILGPAGCYLPDVRVVHCMRDPRDNCLSCFFQNFGPRHLYSVDLEECAHRYVTHLELTRHWREVTDLPVLEFKYEELTADPEAQVRRLLDFLGLDFDEKCLEFHRSKRTVSTASRDQVRQPIYKSSVARWQRYEKHIGPMLDVLREGGAIDD